MAFATFVLSLGSSLVTDDLIGLLHQYFSRTFLLPALLAAVVAVSAASIHDPLSQA